MGDPVHPAIIGNAPFIVNYQGEVLAARRNAAVGIIGGAKVRRAFTIQNVGTNPIFVCMGFPASPTQFHAILKVGSADSDGNGGSFGQEGAVVFQGAVYIAGTNPKAVVTEIV
jgi:hypothetical protein